MPYLKVRNTSHYYEWVCADPGQRHSAKPVMVFIHGWGGSSRYWQSAAVALSDRFDCLLYDLRGFGQSRLGETDAPNLSQGSNQYELEAYAEDLVALLDQLHLDRVYLNAHSMGASIATFFLNFYPERVVQAILTCSGLFEYDEQTFSQFHQFGRYVVQFRPRWLTKIPGMDRAFMARFLHRPIAGHLRRAFLEDFIMAEYEAALGTMLEAVSEKAATIMPDEFARLSVPTLLVSGEHDQIITAEMGRQAAALNPKVEYTVIPKTGHFPMLEDPKTYLGKVRDFLS